MFYIIISKDKKKEDAMVYSRQAIKLLMEFNVFINRTAKSRNTQNSGKA